MAGTLFAWSVLLPGLTAEFGVSSRVLAGPFSTAVAAFAVSVVTAGGAVDHYGARSTVSVAGALSVTGLTTTALAQHVVVLHIGFGLLFGAGSGVAYASVVRWASTRTVAGWRRSVSVVVAAYAAGPVIAGPAGSLCSGLLGWRVTLLLDAAVVACVTVLARGRLTTSDAVSPAAAARTGDRPDKTALSALWLVFLAGSAPGLFGFAYAAELIAERGLDQRLGGLTVAAMGAGNLVGRLVTDSLIACVGARLAMRADLAVMCIALLVLASPSGEAGALLALVLLAAQYGALSVLLPTAVRQLSDPSRFGRTYGSVFSAWGLAGVLASRLHDPAGRHPAAVASWLLLGLAGVTGLAVYERRVAQRRVL